MRLLLETNNFFRNLQKPNVIVALALALLAFVVMLLTNKIVAKFFPAKTEQERLSVALKIKVGCAIVAVVACLLAVLF